MKNILDKTKTSTVLQKATETPQLEPHCTSHLADELNVLPLDVLHHHDLHLVEEMQGKVTQSIPVGGRDLSSAIRRRNVLNHMMCRASGGGCGTANLRMDFWMSSTLQPAFLICFTMLRM